MQAITSPLARAGNCTDITVESNEQWAADIARVVARRYHAIGQEREDLIAEAKAKLIQLVRRKEIDERISHTNTKLRRLLAHQTTPDTVIEAIVVDLCKLAAERGKGKGFSPSLAVDKDMNTSFRVYAHLTIRCTCVRALHGMRGGGCFRTCRPEKVFKVASLGDSAAGVSSRQEEQVEQQVDDPQRATVAQLRDLLPVKKSSVLKPNAKAIDLGNKRSPRELLNLLRQSRDTATP